MFEQRFQRLVTSPDELAEVIGTPSELVLKKQFDHLDKHMQTFISESPFLLLGTVDREGRCDVSPRGDGFGLARVLDPKTFIIPERRGNRRADSLRNILETGRVGLLFLIPGKGETLRVNGAARVIRDEEVLAPLAADGKAPLLGIAVHVEECFLQCAKAVIRSKLWEGGAGRASNLPGFAEILVEQTKIEGQTAASLGKLIEESYANNLY